MQGDTRVTGRLGLVGAVLAAALEDLRATASSPGRPDQPIRVLDCGGGTGTFAVPLAQSGAHVTVVDISADALATLSRRAAEVGVADLVTPVQADVESLTVAIGGAAGGAGFDLALAHGVLDAVDDIAGAFAQIAAAVRPGGLLSVLIANPAAAVLARALAGDLLAALRELDHIDAAAGPAFVQRLCAGQGLVVEQVHGIGVFADVVPGAALDQPAARAALAELEAVCSRRPPFADIAGRVLVLARRPA